MSTSIPTPYRALSKHAKLLVLALLLHTVTAVFALDDAYCDGFAKGFSQRYCLLLGRAATDALPPVCPDPLLGGESEQDGYNRGFLVGLNAEHVCEESDESESGARPRAADPLLPENADLQR